MVRSINEITTGNCLDLCFLPTNKRETVKIYPDSVDKWHLQQYHTISEQDTATQALKLSKKKVPKKIIKYYSNVGKVIDDSTELIQAHVDKRIQLFFQQTILCFNTPFKFSFAGAEDQIGGGVTLTKDKKIYYKTQAAHSSVFPCLYATPYNGDGSLAENKKFVFLKHGYAYNQQNSTFELPLAVNQSDTLIDGKENNKKLRDKSIKIIDQVALGNLNPKKATKQFLAVFEEQVRDSISKLSKTDLKKRVLKIYLEQIREVRKELKGCPEFFDRLMTVDIKDSDKILRKVVYKNRYKSLQDSEHILSLVAKKICKTQNKILDKNLKNLSKIDYRLRISLLQNAKHEERAFLESFFCTSIDQLLHHEKDKKGKKVKEAVHKRKKNAVKKFEEEHHRKIKKLLKDLTIYHRDLQKIEFEYRSRLFKGLRVEYKDWTQVEFVEHFKEKFSSESMSQSMVSRFEGISRLSKKMMYGTPENQRKKRIDVAKAEKIAETFGIDLGLFITGLVTHY